MSNHYKKLMGDTIIFMVGNLGSKLITIIMVPLYTYALSTGEYGSVDLVINTISLFLPIASLAIGEALLRFIMLKDKDFLDIQIMSTSFFLISFVSFLVLIVSGVISVLVNKIAILLMFFSLLLVAQLYQNILSQFIRAKNKLKIFAINGIITTFFNALLNILFLVNLRMGVTGFLLANLIGLCISNIYLFLTGKIWKYLEIKRVSKSVLKRMVHYSLPLVPNTIMWWLIQGSSRYILLFFEGISANGLFAVASKIPSIVSMVTSMFQQAWQLSAFEQNDESSEENFYSSVFQMYYQFLFIICSLILLVIRTLLRFVVNHQYYGSWALVPFLLLGVIYQTLSSFYGTIYASKLETKGVFTSSILGAFISILFGVLLIPNFGVVGSGLSIAFSFFVMWIVRVLDTKKMLSVKFNKKKFIFNNVIFMIQTAILFNFKSELKAFLSQFILFILLLLIDKSFILKILDLFRNKKKAH